MSTASGAETSSGLVPLEPRVLRLWRMRAALVAAPLVLGIVALLATAAPTAAVIAVAFVGGGLAVGGVRWWTALVWRAWQFDVGPEALHLRHGVLTRHESTIPYHRVQHIDLEAGPIERRFGLTSLVLRTASASSDSSVPGIDARMAEDLRRRILTLVGTGDAI